MKEPPHDRIARFADQFAAMGAESRLRIMRMLLSAHPEGMVVGELQAALGLSGPNLSHHLEKLKREGLVNVARQGTFLRYTVETGALRELLSVLYAECCTRNRAIQPGQVTRCGQ